MNAMRFMSPCLLAKNVCSHFINNRFIHFYLYSSLPKSLTLSSPANNGLSLKGTLLLMRANSLSDDGKKRTLPEGTHPNTPLGRLDRTPPKDKKAKKENETEDVIDPFAPFPDRTNPETGEIGGPTGPEPTRYGDWERKGRVSDF